MNRMHEPQKIEIPRNILSPWDLDDYVYDECYDAVNEYDSGWGFDITEVIVITKTDKELECFLTDTNTYYSDITLDKEYNIDDVMSEFEYDVYSVHITDSAKPTIQFKYPEYFI